MPLSLITLLVVAVACLILGGIAGILLGSAGGDQEEDPGARQEEAPPGGRKGHYTAVVRLWREKTSGAVIVEVDGKSYLAPGPLRSDQIERLGQIALDFFTWLGRSEAEIPAAVKPKPAAAVVPQPVESVQAPGILTAVRTESRKQVEAPQAQAPIQVQATPASAPPVINTPRPDVRPQTDAKQPSNARSAPAQPPAAKEGPKTMVEQIDVILKGMAAGTPYEAMGISLTEDPRRGVVVWIGTTSYEGIDGVPDPAIQKFIRSAVAEWERSEDEAARRRTAR